MSVSSDSRNAHAFRYEKAGSSKVWLWFLAAFLVQGAAWTAWFVIASQHKVAEVPLATTTTR